MKALRVHHRFKLSLTAHDIPRKKGEDPPPDLHGVHSAPIIFEKGDYHQMPGRPFSEGVPDWVANHFYVKAHSSIIPLMGGDRPDGESTWRPDFPSDTQSNVAIAAPAAEQAPMGGFNLVLTDEELRGAPPGVVAQLSQSLQDRHKALAEADAARRQAMAGAAGAGGQGASGGPPNEQSAAEDKSDGGQGEGGDGSGDGESTDDSDKGEGSADDSGGKEMTGAERRAARAAAKAAGK